MARPGVVFRALAAAGAFTLVAALAVAAVGREVPVEVHTRQRWHTVPGPEALPDHVHLFLNAPSLPAPDQLMFHIKGRTARVLRQEFPQLARAQYVD
jgi:hypothetical protein